jgi:hypothetical protein
MCSRKASRAPADAFRYPTASLIAIFLSRSRGISSSKIAKVRSAVLSFTLRPLPPNALIVDVALDEAERQHVIDEAIMNLKEYYLYPDIARKMANALLKNEPPDDESAERDGEPSPSHSRGNSAI